MKASELIKTLEKSIAASGDHPVRFVTDSVPDDDLDDAATVHAVLRIGDQAETKYFLLCDAETVNAVADVDD